MARETESDAAVDAPAEGEAPTPESADSGTRWPTWEDIARLHRVPGKDGTVPPPPEPHDEPAEEPSDEVDAEPAGELEPEPSGEREAEPADEAEPEVAGEPDGEPDAGQADETETGLAGEPDTEPDAEPVATDEPVDEVGTAPGPEPETTDDVEAGSAPGDDAEPIDDAPEDETADVPGTESGPQAADDSAPVAEPAAVAAPVAVADPVLPDDATAVMVPVGVLDDPAPADAVETEPEPPDETEVAVERDAEPEVSSDAEPEPEPEAPHDAQAAVEPTAEPEVSSDAEPESEPGPEAEARDETETGAEVAPEPVADPVLPDDATALMPPVVDERPGPAADETVVMAPVAEPEPSDAAPEPVLEPAAAPPARVSVFPATSSAPAASPRVTAGPVPVAAPEPAREPDALDVFPEQRHRSHWGRNTAIALGVVVLLGAAYVGACYATGDRVPRGATVAGVDIGGLSSSDAVARLTSELAPETDSPLTVVANDVQASLDPADAGLAFDAQATVDGLTGVRLAEPGRLWTQVVGIGEVEPVTTVDTTKLAAALASVAGELRAEPVDGAIVFADGTAHATAATDGWEVDQAAAVARIADTWLVAARPIDLPVVPVEPAITQAETDDTLANVAQNVPVGPVTVAIGDKQATLTGAEIAAHAAFQPQDGALVLTLDGQALADDILAQVPDLLTPAADAHFEFQDDHPVIVPGVPGTRLDPGVVATAVAQAAAKPTGRQATVELSSTDPAQSTAALEALGVTQVVSEFDTPLTSDHVRDTNIRQGLANITGVLVRPGEEFSLTEALGPIDAAHGFVEAGAIVNGEHTDAWGGGLSQVSTTTYNAAYLSGMEIVEHHPHSEWFSRYPEGREATIFTGTLDMRWKNNTPYGVLVQGWVSDDRHVHVRFWSTPYWRVESATSGRSNVRATTTVYNQSPTCEAQGAGNPGFTVTVTRKTYLGDDLKNTESWTTTYKPQNKIVCGPPPDPNAPPAG